MPRVAKKTIHRPKNFNPGRIKIAIKNLQDRISISKAGVQKIKKLIFQTLVCIDKRHTGQITVCLIDDKKIRGLNSTYRHENAVTDVLSFDGSMPTEKSKRILAEIAISTDRASANAKFFKTSIFYELCLYAVHGVLHSLGYEDKTLRGRKTMENKANAMLASLKIQP